MERGQETITKCGIQMSPFILPNIVFISVSFKAGSVDQSLTRFWDMSGNKLNSFSMSHLFLYGSHCGSSHHNLLARSCFALNSLVIKSAGFSRVLNATKKYFAAGPQSHANDLKSQRSGVKFK